jgi:hypothetical protein
VAYTKDVDRINGSLLRLSQQFKNSDNIKNIVTIFTTEAATLEDVFWDTYTTTSVDTATFAQLDVWGEILNISRGGQDDAVYRTRLKAAIFRYVSSGKWEEVVQGFRILTNPELVQAEEIYPAGLSLLAVGVTDPAALSYSEILEALRQLKPAGVNVVAAIVASGTPLVFFGDPFPTGLGLGDRLNPDYGGNLADRLTV